MKTPTPPPSPLYDPSTVDPAYHLRYTWTGWPSRHGFPHEPPGLLQQVAPLWETDGIRLLEPRWSRDAIQLIFSCKPHVSPTLLASRAKGRLDHALRGAGVAASFSRKVSVRSVGDNTRKEVETYVAAQVANARFVDADFEKRMDEFSIVDSRVDLAQPTASDRGRYWYNLHLVLVMADRLPLLDFEMLARLRDTSFAIARKKGYGISRLALMPDHLHIAMRGNIQESPEAIAGAFQNNLAYAAGQRRIWRDTFYVGTFGEYNMEAVRLAGESDSPT
jgi:REP element-mobilizing transposase RayT